MAVHECDACGFRGQWSDAWARWGTEDDDVFMVCSSACGDFALPSTRLIGKARGGYLKSADVERARADLMRRRFERATPTEGECSECGATSEERGLLPCDMPGCPRATPTEGD